MGYPIRHFESGRLYETTSRTLQSRLLLRPSEELNSIIRGILARAARFYGVAICYFVVMSNHMHLLVIPESAEQMALFMNYVNANVAKEAGRMHGWLQRLWGRRYRPVLVTEEPEAQLDRLRYLLAHGCKEGLVRKPSEWPGASGLGALLSGLPVVGRWIDRTAAYRARRLGQRVSPRDFVQEESFELVPLPCLGHLSHEERKSVVEAMLRDIEQETRARLAAQDSSPMGARRIVRQHPHDKPVHTKRSPAPLVHAATVEEWLTYKLGWLDFRDRYREAAIRLRRGELGVKFPPGSIPPRLPFSWVKAASGPRPRPSPA